MAVTYGFYNSINKDRAYNAIQMSQIFDGIINDGIYMSVLDHFAVRASGGMNVIVGGGRAWFNHTWTYNDSDLILTIDDSEFEAKRIDAIVLKVDRRDAGRKNEIIVIKGTPADVPVKPVMEDGGDIYYHPLAYVTINANITEITDSMIENAIGVDERTPFVTGIIEHVTAGELIQQWQAEWDEWNDEHRQAYLDWVNQQESDMTNWETTQKEAFLEWMANEKAGYTSWLNASKQEFDDWFENLHYVLDEDVAGHLQNEIDDLHTDMDTYKSTIDQDISDFKDETNEEIFKQYYELCTRNTTYTRDENNNIIGWLSQGDGVTLNVSITETESNKTIVSTINDGTYIWTKTTVMDYSNYTSTESYTKEEIE